MASYSARVRNDRIVKGLCIAATAFGLAWLVLILIDLLWNGVQGLSLQVFTDSMPGPNVDGGLSNAIYGSVVMTVIAVCVGTPIGIMAGTYLAEYGRYSPLASFIRFINDILLSAPSIIIGVFIYEVVVLPIGHYSAIAGSLALAIIVIPVVVRTTENMLLLVPNTLREAASALGLPRSRMIVQIAYRAARAGIITGVLLAIARIAGETAPLLFTAFGNSNFSSDLTQPMGSLPVAIYNFAGKGFDNWNRLAWAGALIITLAVLVMSILARVFGGQRTSR